LTLAVLAAFAQNETYMWDGELLLLLTIEKLRNRLRELDEHRYRQKTDLPEWQFQVDEQGEIGAHPLELTAARPLRIGDHWSGRDLYAWLRATIRVPQEWSGRRVLGRFDFGRTGGGNNSGFESLLFVDGEPYQGVDSNHQEVFLPTDCAGHDVDLCFRLWSGLEGGGKPRQQEYVLRRAQLAWLDEATDDLYFTALATLQTIRFLDENSSDRVDLTRALDRAFLLIDWSNPGSDAFYASVAAARTTLAGALDGMHKAHSVTAYCIGHTHIDVAWLWRLRHTREKSARSFSTVLRLMEMYPEYIFLQTQPQLYDYLKRDYPELYAKVQARVEEGRWEAAGAMWLEADCNLTSGESLVRQILLGTRFFEREFGQKCTYLWLPDVFGYSWALPQILKQSGIDTFMTTKISWNQYNRMPHDTFLWRGLDGSEVLAHFITTPEPGGWGGSRWFYTYNGQLTADTVGGAWNGYRDKEINHNLLISYGFGDGGGGVTRDMLELRRRLDRMPGIPRVVTGRADEYFRQLHETVDESDGYLHTWDGELYLEYHRGTYTSQAYNKRMNRRLELQYRETEWLSVWAGLTASAVLDKAHDALDTGWKTILRNQFHDILPGSSIREVYEDSRLEYADAERTADDVQADAWRALAASDAHGWTVLNSASWNRAGIVRIPVADVAPQVAFVGAAGEVLPAQQCGEEWWVQAAAVPALGASSFEVHPATAQTGQSAVDFQSNNGWCTLQDHGLVTDRYVIEWNEHGHLTRLTDRSAAREVIADGERANVLQVFEDKPLAHDAWDIDIFYQEKMREISELESVECVACGPVMAAVRFCWRYGSSTIVQDMRVYAHCPRIDFVTTADWHEHHQLLKVAFPVAIRATEATYDIQFGNTRRPTHWNTSWDQARFESIGHQWADLAETGYGVMLANDCKYGYDIRDHVMRLSLLKSAQSPDHAADQGEHRFTYALVPHRGTWLEAQADRQAWDLNSPLSLRQGRSAVASDRSLLRFTEDAGLMVDAVKRAEDESRVVVRLHDVSGGRRTVRVDGDVRIRSWQPCDLLERPTGERRTDQLEFELRPFEIRTFLLELALA
jgi:alpha-mannosidase